MGDMNGPRGGMGMGMTGRNPQGFMQAADSLMGQTSAPMLWNQMQNAQGADKQGFIQQAQGADGGAGWRQGMRNAGWTTPDQGFNWTAPQSPSYRPGFQGMGGMQGGGPKQ